MPETCSPAPLQDFAYSYRVWITLNKLLYAPLRYRLPGPDIHQGERLCARLLPSVLRVSEKNSSRKPGEQARSRTPPVKSPVQSADRVGYTPLHSTKLGFRE